MHHVHYAEQGLSNHLALSERSVEMEGKVKVRAVALPVQRLKLEKMREERKDKVRILRNKL